MSRHNSSKRRVIAEINVVPYIDVMLVLLIIFMVTAPLLKQGVEIDLPIAPSANILDINSPEPIVVSVDIDGQMYLNIDNGGDTPVDKDTLIKKLSDARAALPSRPILLRGDGDGRYNNVVKILVLLQQAAIESVSLITDTEAN